MEQHGKEKTSSYIHAEETTTANTTDPANDPKNANRTFTIGEEKKTTL